MRVEEAVKKVTKPTTESITRLSRMSLRRVLKHEAYDFATWAAACSRRS